MSEENPVKKILFEYLESIPSNKIKEAIEKNETPSLLHQIISDTLDKVNSSGDQFENRAVLATGILHFFLTNMMISSQRKVEYNGHKVDVVIPNLRSLLEKPDSSLAIIISDSKNSEDLMKRIEDLKVIQPISKNIWCVVVEDISIENKKFVVGKESFEHILEEINGFVIRKKSNSKLKIFKN